MTAAPTNPPLPRVDRSLAIGSRAEVHKKPAGTGQGAALSVNYRIRRIEEMLFAGFASFTTACKC